MLSLSTQTVQLGQQLTINGSNFVGLSTGAQVLLFEVDGGGTTNSLPSAQVGDNGAFVISWTVAGVTGNVTIKASSPQDGTADPALQASASLVVQPSSTATATASEAPSPSTAPSPTFAPPPGQATTPPSQQQSDNTGLIVFLVTAMAVLLVLLLVAAFLVLRGREGPDAPHGGMGRGPGPGAYPGFRERSQMMPRVTAKVPRVTAKVPQIGQTGRQPVMGRYGRLGDQDQQQAGRVAQWGEPPSVPGPSWQPRPMSGYPPGYPGPTNSTGVPPEDPWEAADEDAFGPRAPYGLVDPRGGRSPGTGGPRGRAFGLPDGQGGGTNPANGDEGW
jgi:hypothetical protein